MQSFRNLFNKKLEDPDFKTLYEAECHVCSNTIQIFAKLFEQNLSLELIGKQLDLDAKDLQLLLDGDYCDPPVVIRLCRHLGLHVPENCPRMPNRY